MCEFKDIIVVKEFLKVNPGCKAVLCIYRSGDRLVYFVKENKYFEKEDFSDCWWIGTNDEWNESCKAWDVYDLEGHIITYSGLDDREGDNDKLMKLLRNFEKGER
jgi:hypothetical protein